MLRDRTFRLIQTLWPIQPIFQSVTCNHWRIRNLQTSNEMPCRCTLLVWFLREKSGNERKNLTECVDKRTDAFHWQVWKYIEKPSKIPTGRSQNLERLNVERPKFRKVETSNIKITKAELFDFSIFEFILYSCDCLNYSNTQNTYLIIYHQIRNFRNFDSFTNCIILKIC